MLMPPRNYVNDFINNQVWLRQYPYEVDEKRIPYAGELILTADHRCKVGDGIHTYDELPYISSTPVSAIDPDKEAAMMYIRDNLELIDNNKFNEFYDKLPGRLIKIVTATLLEADIDPRPFLSAKYRYKLQVTAGDSYYSNLKSYIDQTIERIKYYEDLVWTND